MVLGGQIGGFRINQRTGADLCAGDIAVMTRALDNILVESFKGGLFESGYHQDPACYILAYHNCRIEIFRFRLYRLVCLL